MSTAVPTQIILHAWFAQATRTTKTCIAVAHSIDALAIATAIVRARRTHARCTSPSSLANADTVVADSVAATTNLTSSIAGASSGTARRAAISARTVAYACFTIARAVTGAGTLAGHTCRASQIAAITTSETCVTDARVVDAVAISAAAVGAFAMPAVGTRVAEVALTLAGEADAVGGTSLAIRASWARNNSAGSTREAC